MTKIKVLFFVWGFVTHSCKDTAVSRPCAVDACADIAGLPAEENRHAARAAEGHRVRANKQADKPPVRSKPKL